jgi:hypothetical protein|tara:strand:+ start:1978 stop:2124 length:147 start_codon:yes stop_codon:yes gene_type:complete
MRNKPTKNIDIIVPKYIGAMSSKEASQMKWIPRNIAKLQNSLSTKSIP